MTRTLAAHDRLNGLAGSHRVVNNRAALPTGVAASSLVRAEGAHRSGRTEQVRSPSVSTAESFSGGSMPMSTPKPQSSLRARGLSLLGGALVLALPLVSSVSGAGAAGDESGGDVERPTTSVEEALRTIQRRPHKAV